MDINQSKKESGKGTNRCILPEYVNKKEIMRGLNFNLRLISIWKNMSLISDQ
ncbi:hypothetical protein SF123566_8071 [Shigella flexneri 1235-66]|nr:hypothetical protein SF123566_8071 [Shigella flexneri 1235-66]